MARLQEYYDQFQATTERIKMKDAVVTPSCVHTRSSFSFACFLKAWKLLSMVDLREEVAGPDVFCGDDAWAREDQELAFFTFCSRTGDSYKV